MRGPCRLVLTGHNEGDCNRKGDREASSKACVTLVLKSRREGCPRRQARRTREDRGFGTNNKRKPSVQRSRRTARAALVQSLCPEGRSAVPGGPRSAEKGKDWLETRVGEARAGTINGQDAWCRQPRDKARGEKKLKGNRTGREGEGSGRKEEEEEGRQK